MTALISFDIDGTLEVGHPPGCITMAMVRSAQDAGCIVGSCSDRPVSDQRRIWREYDIAPDFVTLKHQLEQVAVRFTQANPRTHVGDTDADRRAAQSVGFDYLLPEAYLEVVIGD